MEKLSLEKFNEFGIAKDALCQTKGGGTAYVQFHQTICFGGVEYNEYRTYHDTTRTLIAVNWYETGPDEPPCE